MKLYMGEDLLQNGVPTKIGSLERHVVGNWLLGRCSRRNHHDLLRLIKLHVHAGTTILTDRGIDISTDMATPTLITGLELKRNRSFL